MKKIVIVFLTLCFGTSSFATFAKIKFPKKPTQGTFVVDQAHIISEKDRSEINKIASRFLAKRKAPLVLVTIPSLGFYHGKSLGVEAYTQSLFDHWELGSKENNYAVIILLSKKDRKIRVEFGFSYGGRLDTQAQKIMNESVLSFLKNDQFSEGLKVAVKEYAKLANPSSAGQSVSSYYKESFLPSLLKVIFSPLAFIIYILLWILSLFNGPRGPGSGLSSGTIHFRHPHMFYGSFGGGFSGGGGGGFSGGGGASGSF